MYAAIIDDTTGEAFADIHPAPDPWSAQVVDLLAARRRSMKLSYNHIAARLGVEPGAAADLLDGRRPLTLRQAERLAAAMGLVFDRPTVRPVI